MDEKKIVKKNGELFIEWKSTLYLEPVLQTRYFKVKKWVAKRPCTLDDIINDKHIEFSFMFDNFYSFVADYFTDEVVTGEIVEEDFPCPEVRKGTETVYKNGQWNKLTQNGWLVL